MEENFALLHWWWLQNGWTKWHLRHKRFFFLSVGIISKVNSDYTNIWREFFLFEEIGVNFGAIDRLSFRCATITGYGLNGEKFYDFATISLCLVALMAFRLQWSLSALFLGWMRKFPSVDYSMRSWSKWTLNEWLQFVV